MDGILWISSPPVTLPVIFLINLFFNYLLPNRGAHPPICCKQIHRRPNSQLWSLRSNYIFKTKYATALLKNLQWLPISHRIKLQTLQHGLGFLCPECYIHCPPHLLLGPSPDTMNFILLDKPCSDMTLPEQLLCPQHLHFIPYLANPILSFKTQLKDHFLCRAFQSSSWRY